MTGVEKVNREVLLTPSQEPGSHDEINNLWNLLPENVVKAKSI